MSRFICIVLAIIILVAFSGCSAPVAAGDATVPAHTVDIITASVSATVTETPGTTQPDVTATAPPDDTSQPEGPKTTDVTGTKGTTSTPEPIATPSNGGTLSVNPVIGKVDMSEYLTLRKTASSSAESLTQIPKDGEFTVLQVETGKKWLKVKYEDMTGYVEAKYVKVGSDDGDRVCTVFCNSVLNVRKGAGTSHDIIGSIGSGTSLIVKSISTVGSKKWYAVEIGSSTGYVIAQYCRIAED